jgi:ABC-type multidrug transport system fused ATPase/permease subunit
VSVREAVSRALALLSRRDRRLLSLSIIMQVSASVLDLVGVLLIGIVAALAVTTVQSAPPPQPVIQLAETLGIDDLTSQSLILVFSLLAAIVLLTRSFVSAFLLRRVFVFLANRQALVSARLYRELLAQPLVFVQARSSQQTAFALIAGAGAATMSILGQLVILISELSLLILMAVTLLIVSPWTAIASIAYFAGVAWVLQRTMGNWAGRIGREAVAADVASLNSIQEALSAYREITVTNRRSLYVDRLQDTRWAAARVAADALLIGMLPKYIFEAAMVLGGFMLAGFLFATQTSTVAVGTLAIFIAAATRVMPALLRLQGATLGLRGAAGGATSTFELADDLAASPIDVHALTDQNGAGPLYVTDFSDFEPSINLRGVQVTYPGRNAPALRGVSLEIPAGHSLALVGKSGAGKSTLADVILGVVEPDAGSVTLGGLSPSRAIRRWPGGIGYVPQETVVADASIRANVALGIPRTLISDEQVWKALERAHLADFLSSERDGLDTYVGEDGMRLSGGQRQRLGIARALYTQPRLLVLDEATSALDAETEVLITQTIADLEGEVTLVIIAHRLSTVRNCDKVAYLHEGEVVASGSFDEVRQRVPRLERQAALMGLR